jgi:hypothetical protein
LTDRQWEVLDLVAGGKSVAAKEGKRIDVTLNSLVQRGLIEKVVAGGKQTGYRVTKTGQGALELRSKSEKPKAPKRKKAAGAVVLAPRKVAAKRGPSGERGGGFPVVVEAETFEPRVGQLVWRWDGGQRDPAYYRVVKVRVIDAKLETWSGDSWAPITAWQLFEVLEPLTDAELTTAKRNGVDVG